MAEDQYSLSETEAMAIWTDCYGTFKKDEPMGRFPEGTLPEPFEAVLRSPPAPLSASNEWENGVLHCERTYRDEHGSREFDSILKLSSTDIGEDARGFCGGKPAMTFYFLVKRGFDRQEAIQIARTIAVECCAIPMEDSDRTGPQSNAEGSLRSASAIPSTKVARQKEVGSSRDGKRNFARGKEETGSRPARPKGWVRKHKT